MSTVNAVTREAYQFAAEPKAVPSRSKYRDPNEKKSSDYEDIQNDPRVRGTQGLSGAEKSKGHVRKATNQIGRNAEEEGAQENVYAPLSHRNHQDDASVRPYFRIDRPPTPEYKPLPPGIEVATQVEDYELFDYILEVEPILQVLVGKTLEQAQIELREEDERIEEARHKMRFEKVRNAELMVTQRKEALHIRKQDEKARREKQHIIEKEAKYIAHQKYISRLFAKHVTTDMNNVSIRTLVGQGVLNSNFRTELKKDYVPYLVLTTLYKIRHQGLAAVEVQKTLEELQQHLHASHARSVKQEFDRIKKIEDDKKAAEDRRIAEQKRRRERRRLLRLYCNKVETLNKIENVIMSRPLEVEDLFAQDITDVFPTGKEQVATIGGILGELWLVLDSLKENGVTDLSLDNIVQILVKLLNEKFKNKEITINISESQQQYIQAVLDQMNNDLIQFNQNKTDYIQELLGQLENINNFQNLSLLSSENLLDKDLFNEINKSLLFIYFTSVDYKIPEKKVEVEEAKEATGEIKNENPEEAAGDQEPKPVDEQNPEGTGPSEGAEGTEKPAEETQPVPEPVQEEEFKLPEVTPFELELLEAKKKLKLNFVADWEYRKNVDGILRIRNPLNRETKQASMEKLEKTDGSAQVTEPKVASTIEEPVVEEDRDTMLRRLIATDDFIEPFNGTTFEKEKENFPEQEVDPAAPTRIFNTGLIPEYIVHVNERAQKVLRKELIALIKATVAAYNNIPELSVYEAANDKYNSNEKVVFNSLISNPESIPIFDLENL